jgi:hypothetical protein
MCASHSTKAKNGRVYAYDYYRCSYRNRHSADACANSKTLRAEELEPAVWALVSDLLKEPHRLRAGLEKLIEEERRATRGDPDRESKVWAKKLGEVEQERRAYQRLAARGSMTDEELDQALLELEETRKTAERELRAAEGRKEHLEQLERDRDALMECYAGMVPEALEGLTPQERQAIYKTPQLTVVVPADELAEVTGAFGGPLENNALGSVKEEGTSRSNPYPTSASSPRAAATSRRAASLSNAASVATVTIVNPSSACFLAHSPSGECMPAAMPCRWHASLIRPTASTCSSCVTARVGGSPRERARSEGPM